MNTDAEEPTYETLLLSQMSFGPPPLKLGGAPEPMVRRLGRIELLSRLGEGGAGVAYRARHPIYGVVCAKVLKSGSGTQTGALVRRFQLEAAAAERLDHPHIVRGLGLEEAEGQPIMLQELVTGGDLSEALRGTGGLACAEALRLGREVALGLAAIHAEGLVHRDLKPANVFLDRQRRAKIGDLGLALHGAGLGRGDVALTLQGEKIGTPLFMAPEQWEDSHRVDPRTDLYALGVLLYYLLSERYPHRGETLRQTMLSHLTRPPASLQSRRSDIPAEVEFLVLELLTKDPKHRPSSARAVALRISQLQDFLGYRKRAVAASQRWGAAESARRSRRVIAERYALGPLLGRGGMGIVFRALDLQRGEEDVAIKFLNPRLRNQRQFRERFQRELRALQAFRHPAAINIRAWGEVQDTPYMVLDYARGETLSAIIERDGCLTIERALNITRQILLCLAFAHAKGIIHRDLKPDNIMVRSDDDGEHITILDFGLAKLRDDKDSCDPDDPLTVPGMVIGTPRYMAPEQDAGLEVDERADLYAVAAILYELLAGATPLEASTAGELHRQIQCVEPIAVERRAEQAIPAPLSSAIMSALSKEPAGRPRDARAFLRALTSPSPTAPASAPEELPRELERFARSGTMNFLKNWTSKVSRAAIERRSVRARRRALKARRTSALRRSGLAARRRASVFAILIATICLACIALPVLLLSGSGAAMADGGRDVGEALIEALGHEDVRVRGAAVAGLRALGPGALPRLLAALGHSDQAIRIEAITLLGELSDHEQALAALKDAAADPNPELRRAALRALRRHSENKDALSAPGE